MMHLKERQIGTEIYYPVPMHLQECFAELGHRPDDYLSSEQAALETLAWPVYPGLTENLLRSVVSAVADFYGC